VEYGAVFWPGGIDIAPETLYDRSMPVRETESGANSASVVLQERFTEATRRFESTSHARNERPGDDSTTVALVPATNG